MSAKLNPVGSQFQVNQITANPQDSPDIVALSDGRFVVVYNSAFNNTGTDIDIYGQFVNPNGTLSGGLIPIANPGGIQDDPAVAARSGGGFTTVWQDFGTTTGTPTPSPDVYYAVTGANGTNATNRTLLMDGQSWLENPDIATMSD